LYECLIVNNESIYPFTLAHIGSQQATIFDHVYEEGTVYLQWFYMVDTQPIFAEPTVNVIIFNINRSVRAGQLVSGPFALDLIKAISGTFYLAADVYWLPKELATTPIDSHCVHL